MQPGIITLYCHLNTNETYSEMHSVTSDSRSGWRKETHSVTSDGSGGRKEAHSVTSDGSGWRKETHGVTSDDSCWKGDL